MAQRPDRAEAKAGPPAGIVPPRLRRWGMDAVYGGLIVLLAPYAAIRFIRDPKTRSRWKAYAKDLPTRFGRREVRGSRRPCIWIHGVSVGEVKAAAELVEGLEAALPEAEVVVSVSTDTARRVARDRYRGRRVMFYPPDLSWVVGNAFDAIRPDLIVVMESDLWPNFLSTAQERGVPVVLVNGRISERSATRYRRVGQLAQPMVGALTLVCAQLPVYADRFRGIGIPESQVHVTGNMKFDNIPVDVRSPGAQRLESILQRNADAPLVVAGSTHPGEEEAMARIRRRLGERGRSFRLVIAPRHPARADAVDAALRREGLQARRRSAWSGPDGLAMGEVLLLDTVGELEAAYAAADVSFVGGSLVRHGGQNVMEPASVGCPVVVGPYTHNFRGEVDMLRQAGGIAIVEDEAGLEATIEKWLADPETRSDVGARAGASVAASKGATARTLEVIAPLLVRLRSRSDDA